jgi:hypothetical protein
VSAWQATGIKFLSSNPSNEREIERERERERMNTGFALVL